MTKEGVKAGELAFRWKYIILPVALLLLSILLSAYFYRLLPAEVAYHFEPDGTPDKWFSRRIAMVWALAPQFLFTLLAAVTILGITKLGLFFSRMRGATINLEKILSLMGNIIALPQFIICFAILDIFSYNSYKLHIVPMRIFLFTILGLATIALILLLVFIFQKARQQYISQPKD